MEEASEDELEDGEIRDAVLSLPPTPQVKPSPPPPPPVIPPDMNLKNLELHNMEPEEQLLELEDGEIRDTVLALPPPPPVIPPNVKLENLELHNMETEEQQLELEDGEIRETVFALPPAPPVIPPNVKLEKLELQIMGTEEQQLEHEDGDIVHTVLALPPPPPVIPANVKLEKLELQNMETEEQQLELEDGEIRDTVSALPPPPPIIPPNVKLEKLELQNMGTEEQQLEHEDGEIVHTVLSLPPPPIVPPNVKPEKLELQNMKPEMYSKDEDVRDTVLPLPPLLPPPPLFYWLLPPPPVIPPNFKPEKLEPQYMKPRNQQSPGRLRISRPGVGREGQRIPLLVNHFKASVNVPDATFYQYTVSITSEDKGCAQIKGIGRKLMESLYQTYCSELGWKHLTYDGETSLYTVGPLPRNWFEFKVVLEESPLKRNRSPGFDNVSEIECKRLKRCSYQAAKIFKIEIRFSRKIPIQAIGLALKGCNTEGAVDAMRVLDIIIKQQAAERGCLLVRQSFYHGDVRNFVSVGDGITGVRGFHSSFRTTQSGLTLNMDVSTTVTFTPGPVIQFLLTNQRVTDPHQIDWGRAKRMLKNLLIKAQHNNMEFKIKGLSEKPCKDLFFLMKMRNEERKNEVKTVELTVYDYFTKHRKLELTTSAYMPCIDVGRPKKPNYIPLELCSLMPLQRYTKSLSSVQRAFLSEKTPKPLERIISLTDFMNNSRYEADPSLSACGVSIEKQMIPVEGRVLGTPGLKVGNNVDCFPDNGKWNYSGQTLYEPVKIQRWAVVNFSARWDTSYLSRELINGARDKGIHMDPPYSLIEEDYQSRRLTPIARVEMMFEQIKTKLPGPPELLLCVLERRNSDIYGPWKNKCLSELGIVTQCLIPAKINDLYITNVLLKINTKLGGKNSLLAVEQVPRIPLISETPTMILGMDVSHGAPGRSDVPSIAAVVGSRCWPLISRYRACVRTQSPREEMIDSLYKPLPNGEDDGIIRELLLDFYETSNGRKPSQIVIFRDGVAASQFNQVLNIELEQIIKAFNHLGETELPKFTLVVAQKSHHTKLFKSGGSPENVPAGTVVDTEIVHPRYYDFYMCAHNGAKGTSRPAHYNVLLDEIGFSPDELQKLVHSLSYVYQRSTTAVSVVAPVCYAHHAAAQMAQFIKSGDVSNYSASNSPFRELPRLHPNVRNSMFFC